jgi:hypothetical protein
VRITVSHNGSKEEVMQSVDRSFNELLQGVALAKLKLTDAQRSWQGNTLTFSLRVKMGWISAPIKGTVEVTDRDVTIDADLGLLERLIPATTAREVISSRIRGLLN